MRQKQSLQLPQAQFLFTLALEHFTHRRIGLRLVPETHLRTLLVFNQVGDLNVRFRSVFGVDGRNFGKPRIAGFRQQFLHDFEPRITALRQQKTAAARTAGNVNRLLYATFADGFLDLAVQFRIVAGARVLVEKVDFRYRNIDKQPRKHLLLAADVHRCLCRLRYQQAAGNRFRCQLDFWFSVDGIAHDCTSRTVSGCPTPSSGSRFSRCSPNI